MTSTTMERKKFSITPKGLEFLRWLLEKKMVSSYEISQLEKSVCRTVSSLREKCLISSDHRGHYSVTERGKSLLELTPRWSGQTENKFQERVAVWNLFDYGTHFSSFSLETTRLDLRKDLESEYEPTKE